MQHAGPKHGYGDSHPLGCTVAEHRETPAGENTIPPEALRHSSLMIDPTKGCTEAEV